MKIKNDHRVSLHIPDRLAKPDKLILLAKKDLADKKLSEYYRIHDLLSCSYGNLDIRVAPQNTGRALRFMDTLIKALRARGHDIGVGNHTRAIVFGEEIRIIFREKTKKVLVDDRNRSRSEFHPTGIIAFQIDHYPSKEWKDGARPLETQLAAIIAKLELNARYWQEIRLENERAELVWKEEERVQHELRERKEKEISDFKKLLHQASRWRKANMLRCYIDHVEENAITNNTISEVLTTWLAWALEKADWYDQLIENEDDWNKDVENEKIHFAE